MLMYSGSKEKHLRISWPNGGGLESKCTFFTCSMVVQQQKLWKHWVCISRYPRNYSEIVFSRSSKFDNVVRDQESRNWSDCPTVNLTWTRIDCSKNSHWTHIDWNQQSDWTASHHEEEAEIEAVFNHTRKEGRENDPEDVWFDNIVRHCSSSLRVYVTSLFSVSTWSEKPFAPPHLRIIKALSKAWSMLTTISRDTRYGSYE